MTKSQRCVAATKVAMIRGFPRKGTGECNTQHSTLNLEARRDGRLLILCILFIPAKRILRDPKGELAGIYRMDRMALPKIFRGAKNLWSSSSMKPQSSMTDDCDLFAACCLLPAARCLLIRSQRVKNPC